MKHLTLGALLMASASITSAQVAVDVHMVNGQLQVSQEQTLRASGQISVQWLLRTPGYQFPANGVSISPSGEHRCSVLEKGRVFRCDKVVQPGSKEYRYVVRVVETPTLKLILPPQPDLWIQDE